MKRAMMMKHGAVAGLLAALLVGVTGCAETPVLEEEKTEVPTNEEIIQQDPEATVGGEENTFDHMDDLGASGGKTDAEIMEQRLAEGPAEVRTRLHSCSKLPVETLQNVLESIGVNIGANAQNGQPQTAGQLYRNGQNALGVADYDSRVATPIVWSSSGAAKAFDIWTQAAQEVITNIASMPQCQLNGAGVEMFDANNQCNRDAVTCIIGMPASDDHLALCNAAVAGASSVDKGKIIAVATLLASQNFCE